MNFSELKPDAIYRLTEDVKNPHADRRYKRQPNMVPVWKEGTRFLAREEVFENTHEEVKIRVVWYRLEFVDHRFGSMYAIPAHESPRDDSDHSHQAAAIMAVLEPTEEDFDALTSRLQLDDYALTNLLRRLCATGAVTHKQIEDEANHWMNEPEED
jgi:hypothetical protein